GRWQHADLRRRPQKIVTARRRLRMGRRMRPWTLGLVLMASCGGDSTGSVDQHSLVDSQTSIDDQGYGDLLAPDLGGDDLATISDGGARCKSNAGCSPSQFCDWDPEH